MALSDKLTELINTKEKIRVAIEDKGQDLNGIEFRDWFTKILDIPGGGPLSPSVGPSYLDTLDEADQIKDYGSKWESMSDTLIELTNAKENIRLAIEDKGQDLTGVEFRDYDLKISDIAPPWSFKTTGFGNSDRVLNNDSILTTEQLRDTGNRYVFSHTSTLDNMYPYSELGLNTDPLVENGNTMLWVPPYYWTPTLSSEGYLREITISEQPISGDSILSKGVWIGTAQTNNLGKSQDLTESVGNKTISAWRDVHDWTNPEGKQYGTMNIYDWQSLKILMWVYFKSTNSISYFRTGQSSSYNTARMEYNGHKTWYISNFGQNSFFGFSNLLGSRYHLLDGVTFTNWNSSTQTRDMYATDNPSIYKDGSVQDYNYIYRTPASGFIKEVTVVNGLIVPAVTTGASRTTYYGNELNLGAANTYTNLIVGRSIAVYAYEINAIQEGLSRMYAINNNTYTANNEGSRLRREE